MIVVTTDSIPGKRVVKTLGLVRGNTIRARHVGKDILAGLKGLVGGEIAEYTKMVAESREQCLDRLVEEAEALGANAVVGIRFTTASMMQSAAELLAYGTAVIIEEEERRFELLRVRTGPPAGGRDWAETTRGGGARVPGDRL